MLKHSAKIKKILKNKDGFTLLETIAAVAALALLSAFILQMFVVSAKANLKAKNIDIASAQAVTAIDSFKVCRSADEFYDTGFAGIYASYVNTDSEAGDYSYDVYYDSDWKLLMISLEPPMDGVSREPDNKELSNMGVKFVMRIKIAKADAKEPNFVSGFSVSGGAAVTTVTTSGVLFDITVTVSDISADEGKQELVSYETRKFFSAQ